MERNAIQIKGVARAPWSIPGLPCARKRDPSENVSVYIRAEGESRQVHWERIP